MSSGHARRIAAKNFLIIRRSLHCKTRTTFALLPHLHQGATLSIRSHVPVTSVHLEPAWRDSGHVTFQQVLAAAVVVDDDDKNSLNQQQQQRQNPHEQQQQQVEMIVSLEKDQMTSLGRKESHVSLILQPATATVPESSSFNKPTASDTICSEGTEGKGQVEEEVQIEEELQQTDAEPGIYLTVQIPEKVNISCELNHGGSIFITHGNKVEGDVRLVTTHGNIHVKKLRGQYLELKAATAAATSCTGSSSTSSSSNINNNVNNTNTILVSDLLEAQKLVMETTGGRIRVKQIHARTANITVNAAAVKSSLSSSTSPSTFLPMDSSMLQVDDEGSLIDISSFYISGSSAGADADADAGDSGATLVVQGPCQPQRRAVRVKSHHGPLQVETYQISKPREVNVLTNQIYPIVELGGVNGNVEVSMTMMKQPSQHQEEPSSMTGEDRHEHHDENNNNNNSWSSCCVHVDSLSQDSVSLISVDNTNNNNDGGGGVGGDISLTLDRKVEADLRFASINIHGDGADCCLDEISALLAEEEDDHLVVEVLKHLPKSNQDDEYDDASLHPREASPHHVESRIDIDTTAFTPLSSSSSASFKSDTLEYIQGWVENKSHEPDSRFERKIRGEESTTTSGSVGKIRIASAAEQALHGFTTANNKTEDKNAVSSSAAASSSYLRPLLAVVNNRGRIKVETVSWLGAIARRYGLEETTERRRDVGRTAAKRGRPFAWRNDE